MSQLQLHIRELGPNDELAFHKAYQDWSHDPIWMSFEFKPGMTHAEHLQRLYNAKHGIDLPGTLVPSTMYYGFLENEIIGRVHIRHVLNENLFLRGGHLGYAVTERFRGHGLAKKLCSFAIDILKRVHKQDRILITCGENNIASIKVISVCGGVLENVTPDQDGEMTCRYWVS